MNRSLKIENIILLALWILLISTFSIALLREYDLFYSDYLGILGLIIVTFISIKRQDKLLISIFILLVLGLFNLISFAYFINVVLTFGIMSFMTPGIQLISLLLLLLLVFYRRKELFKIYKIVFGQDDNERDILFTELKTKFKQEFSSLSDFEIESRLKENIVPEAKEALNEIKNERK